MKHQDYTFSFSIFAKKVQMFHWNNMGIVVEKEPDVICIYGTDEKNEKILCAIPLCHPKYIKGADFRISFFEDNAATVEVAEMKVFIDFTSHKCSNNKRVQNYGSEIWGEEVNCDWSPAFENRFN